MLGKYSTTELEPQPELFNPYKAWAQNPVLVHSECCVIVSNCLHQPMAKDDIPWGTLHGDGGSNPKGPKQ
jgi:hypothetical protein